MNESKSFDDIVNSLVSLNINQRDDLLHILEADKIRNTSDIPIKIYTNKYFEFSILQYNSNNYSKNGNFSMKKHKYF